ncbi:MAG TPA: MipA/OmpV family protein [Burkholderiales bacterium]|nr:MipA/OmpV family protein [Burkholderiales bacterium]
MQSVFRICKGLLLLWLAASFAHADQLPLWEAGAGFAVTTLPHYRGSDQAKTWVLPVPYVVYRGASLKVDDDRRLRGLLGDKVEVELSLSGSPPAKDNDARRGMPDLDATLELGPSLNITLFRSENRNEKLELRLPVRTVFSSDFSHVRQTGWVFQPNLSLDFKNVLGDRGWKLGLQGSLIYTNRRYNQYFYAVDPVFVTADRPAFDPSGGYGGLNFLAAVSKHFPGFWVGGFAKWDSVSGAVFADSPLVRARSNFSGGFAVAWIFRASTAKVEAEN